MNTSLLVSLAHPYFILKLFTHNRQVNRFPLRYFLLVNERQQKLLSQCIDVVLALRKGFLKPLVALWRQCIPVA